MTLARAWLRQACQAAARGGREEVHEMVEFTLCPRAEYMLVGQLGARHIHQHLVNHVVSPSRVLCKSIESGHKCDDL